MEGLGSNLIIPQIASAMPNYNFHTYLLFGIGTEILLTTLVLSALP
jgi:hypothetical protein